MADNNTGITDQLNLIRSILRSDDHLQIQPSGDYEQVHIKLDHDVQISFFFNSLQLLSQPLTINSIHDFRINKSSNKCPLTNEQWTNLRRYFDDMVQTSDKNASLHSIIQLIQDQLLKTRIANPKFKPKEKKSSASASSEDASMMSNRFRGGDLIFSRILHDKSIDRSQVVIGYEDRFTGIHEIAFNEFKKVHDHEYGVPMHRIRYYKISGTIVWDRTNKIDALTGTEQLNQLSDDAAHKFDLVQGLYHFDQSLQQWTQCPHISLAVDDPKISSTNDTCLPQQCHFVTWNILFDYHHSQLIHTSERYPAILSTLKSLLPDVICLQEVTATFLHLLLDELWLQEHHYYVIIMQSVINSDKDKSYGQLILTKNIRPRSFSICPLDVSENLTTTSSTTAKKTSKELIIARFGLTSRITIDLVNLHLHSDLSHASEAKRCRALEHLFKQNNTNNYMLVGDFNFGDYHEKEQNILEKYATDVHDLWKKMYNLEENPGFTFDPSRNTCAHITSVSQIKRRLDRYFIHTLQNLSYSVEHLTMIGTDPIPIDRLNNDDDKRVNLSDHYGLQLMIQFRTRSISHRSALVLLPSSDQWPLIDCYRQPYDPSFGRWPPHINLLWPFFDLSDSADDEENILLPLRLLLCQHQSFAAEVVDIDRFVENNICFMKLDQQSTERVKQLYEQMKQLFPQCCIKDRNGYNPHMTIAQFDSTEKRNQAQSSLTLSKPFQFPVEYLYLLQRPHDNDTTPFHITCQVPIGPVLQPLRSNRAHCVDAKLQEVFQSMNLYESEESYQRKEEKFHKLSSCFDQVFNKETLHCFTHTFLLYGSFRIGVAGADVDTVFVLNEAKSNENDATTFDETLRDLKDDEKALNNYIADFLETQIKGNLGEEIISCRKIQALFPIILILFKDQTRVEIFVQTETNKERSQQPIHGVDEIEHLLIHARSPPIFQHLLSFIRSWSRHVGLYGDTYGYLCGYSWAVLCAHICHSSLSSIPSLSSIEHFSIDDFFSLVHNFFSTYARFPWSAQAFRLHPTSARQITQPQKPSVHNRGAMRILSPISPFNNTARSTLKSTRDLIVQGFDRVLELLDQTPTVTSEDKINALQKILQLTNDFPNQKIKSVLQLTFSCGSEEELDEWTGWMKSRLAYFLTDCEEKCHFAIQTQNTTEHRSTNTETLYSIGFPVDEETLNHHQTFNNRLNKFLDQFSLCPNRKETMQVSHKVVSVHDWKLERMQPKSQRTRK